MKFHRITPMQQETLYVLSADDEDVDLIAHNPICFSPISYSAEEVDPGDIPAQAKIVLIDQESKKISRINLDTALKLVNGVSGYAINDITAALETLRNAMLRNGLRGPKYIQLESFEQAYKLVEGFEKYPSLQRNFNIAKHMKPGQAGEFWIMGVQFRWPGEAADPQAT